jgi:hypothetical protein
MQQNMPTFSLAFNDGPVRSRESFFFSSSLGVGCAVVKQENKKKGGKKSRRLWAQTGGSCAGALSGFEAEN